jgi:hypothetical protein
VKNTGRRFARWLAAMATLSLPISYAHAQMCCTTGPTCHLVSGWPTCDSNGCVSLDAAVAATGSGPSSDTAFNPGGLATGHSYAITGQKLVGINNTDGSILFSRNVNNATLDNFPNPVILTADCTGGANCPTSTKITNFIAGDDGNLYKVVYDTTTQTTTTTFTNLQRVGCSLDKLKGTPAVQLNRFSNAAFQTAMGDAITDLVIVGTYYPDQGPACPGGKNRVYGIRSSDLTVKWTFNQTGSTTLDEVTEACYPEYYPTTGNPAGTNNNMVVCGINETVGTIGLIALNTTSGTQRWATNTGGGVIVRPVIATLNGRRAVYVGCSDAFLRAYSPATGMAFWTASVPLVQNGITQNFWAEFRGGVLTNHIFVIATDGTFRRFVDNGTSGVEEGMGITADSTGTVKFTSMAVVVPNPGMDELYVGRSDGQVQQISSAYLLQEAQRVGAPGSNVFDPVLDLASDGTATHLVVTAGASGAIPGKIARLELQPTWCTTPPAGILGGCVNPSDLQCKAAPPASNR